MVPQSWTGSSAVGTAFSELDSRSGHQRSAGPTLVSPATGVSTAYGCAPLEDEAPPPILLHAWSHYFLADCGLRPRLGGFDGAVHLCALRPHSPPTPPRNVPER